MLSGGLARVVDREPDDKIRAGRQPHRRHLREADRLDERAESPLGQLALREIITEEQYEAGIRYAVVVGQYRATIEAPRGVFHGSGRGVSCFADVICQAEPDKCPCTMRKVRYDDAYAAVWQAGQRAAKVVARVAVHREEIAAADVRYLRDGLVYLARHFGLTGRERGRIVHITF